MLIFYCSSGKLQLIVSSIKVGEIELPTAAKRSAAILLILCAFHVFAQTKASDDQEKESESAQLIAVIADPQLAMSVPDYPVTAGDVYDLTFAAGQNSVHVTLPVDTSYRIRVANLGIIRCEGLTYNQLKSRVESLISQNYPMGGPQFMLSKPAVFLVSITGEVVQSTEEKAWALTRLSSFIAPNVTKYSSERNITIVHADGKKNVYDLYKARRDGDFSQNPYLRPGDKIIIGRQDRIVSIQGSVERPGTYELLANENLQELIYGYASGITRTADLSRIRLIRIDDGKERLQKVHYLSEDDVSANIPLVDKDSIFIPDWSDLQPFVELKGVIKNPVTFESEPNMNQDSSSAMYRTKISFYVSENYASLIRRIENYFTVFSDLKAIFVERNNEEILLDAERILLDMDFESPYQVERNDVIVVPYRPFS